MLQAHRAIPSHANGRGCPAIAASSGPRTTESAPLSSRLLVPSFSAGTTAMTQCSQPSPDLQPSFRSKCTSQQEQPDTRQADMAGRAALQPDVASSGGHELGMPSAGPLDATGGPSHRLPYRTRGATKRVAGSTEKPSGSGSSLATADSARPAVTSAEEAHGSGSLSAAADPLHLVAMPMHPCSSGSESAHSGHSLKRLEVMAGPRSAGDLSQDAPPHGTNISTPAPAHEPPGLHQHQQGQHHTRAMARSHASRFGFHDTPKLGPQAPVHGPQGHAMSTAPPTTKRDTTQQVQSASRLQSTQPAGMTDAAGASGDPLGGLEALFPLRQSPRRNQPERPCMASSSNGHGISHSWQPGLPRHVQAEARSPDASSPGGPQEHVLVELMRPSQPSGSRQPSARQHGTAWRTGLAKPDPDPLEKPDRPEGHHTDAHTAAVPKAPSACLGKLGEPALQQWGWLHDSSDSQTSTSNGRPASAAAAAAAAEGRALSSQHSTNENGTAEAIAPLLRGRRHQKHVVPPLKRQGRSHQGSASQAATPPVQPSNDQPASAARSLLQQKKALRNGVSKLADPIVVPNIGQPDLSGSAFQLAMPDSSSMAAMHQPATSHPEIQVKPRVSGLISTQPDCMMRNLVFSSAKA